MNWLLALLAENPTPIPLEAPDETFNSPGLVGFLVTFAVAGIAVLLFFDMNRRVRRTRYRQEIRQRLADEQGGDGVGDSKPMRPTRPEPPAPPSRS
jgi:uncharacterized integral membrane protein